MSSLSQFALAYNSIVLKEVLAVMFENDNEHDFNLVMDMHTKLNDLAFEVIFIGKKLVDEVPDTLMHLVENLKVWNDFRWGSLIWWKRTPKSYQGDWLGRGSNCLKDLIIVYYLARTPPTTYTDLFDDYIKKLSASRKQGKIDTRYLSIIRRCDTTIVEEIRLKDGVIAKLNSRVFKLEAIIKIWILESFEGSLIWWNRDPKIIPRGLAWSRKQLFKRSDYSLLFGRDSPVNLDLTPTISEQQTVWYDTTIVEDIRLKDGVIAKLNSRVFKLEAIIKVLGRERKGVSLEKSCVAEIFNNFSSGCWEELNEEFNVLCETIFFLNGPAMIDLDPDNDLVQRRDRKQKMLKYDEDKKKRRHELMNSDHWKHSVSKITNGKRTQRSSAFSAYYWGNTFAMAEKDRPLNSLNDQDMNIFLKDVTPWVEDISCYNQATDIVHLSDTFDIFLVDKDHFVVGFDGAKMLVSTEDHMMLIGPWLVVTLSSFSFKTRSHRGMLMARCTKSLGAMLKSRHQMEPHDQAYKCTCEKGDVVLRTSCRPHSYGKKYFARHCSKPVTQDRGCGYFMWMDDFMTRISSSSGPSTRPSYYAGTSGSTLNLRKEKCSNCKLLAEKIRTLEAKIKILEGTLEMERHPENYTLESVAILHELYNDMGKLGSE
uniref:Uncharacterized protein n=1 Tax=Tanacetum cinerariifolium TaxID=118510 RepID=A0A6L2KWR0_TANCI|nr:hypothetical protein [Tanacetum cinerariifolium]